MVAIAFALSRWLTPAPYAPPSRRRRKDRPHHRDPYERWLRNNRALNTIALVGSYSEQSTDLNGFTSAAQTTTTANFIVVHLSTAGVAGYTLTDSKSNTWVKLTPHNQASNHQTSVLYYTYNASVGSGHTFTISGSGNFPNLTIAWYSGVKSSADPFGGEVGGTATAFGTTEAWDSSLTPSEDGCLVVSGLNVDTTASWAIGSSFTIRQSLIASGHSQSGAIADIIQTTAGTVNPTWTISASKEMDCSGAWFKSAGAAATPRPRTIVRQAVQRATVR